MDYIEKILSKIEGYCFVDTAKQLSIAYGHYIDLDALPNVY